MNLNSLQGVLNSLDQYKCVNSKAYKQVSLIMNLDATTHNIEKAKELLKKLKEQNGKPV